MKKVQKKLVCLALVLTLAVSSLLPQTARASEPGSIYYCAKGEKGQYCECLDDAFQACQEKGGRIVIYQDREINFPDYIPYRSLNKDTTLMVEEGAVLTIGEHGFQMDGQLQIVGRVDLEHSEGILYGEGSIRILGNGSLVKRPYEIDKKGWEECLEAKPITYGQTLSEAEIPKEQIHWRAGVEGTWSFCHPDYVPQAGTKAHDVIFTPRYPMTYETKAFEQCGSVTTHPAVPVRKQYEPVELHVGENLLEVEPELCYVSPVTGEAVPGNFSFDESQQTLLQVGEQEIRGTFTPKDLNYTAVNQYVKVRVSRTAPEIITEPVVRNQGCYGQTLGQIRFLPGSCINPYNGKTVSGSWEWKDDAGRLRLGTEDYTMLFIPDEEGYERKELRLSVTTLPKVMEDIEWPDCTDLVYGEALADSELSFDKNEYGVFYWQNERLCPKVKNSGAAVVFCPADADIYDWSRLAGYDRESGTVTFQIPVRVRAAEGQLPAVEALGVKEGSCVSDIPLQVQGAGGEIAWKDPDQIVEKSDWYDLYFTPEDTDNYDWNQYHPDGQGRIGMKVYVTAEGRNPMGNSAVENQSSVQVQTEQRAAEEVSPYLITRMVSKLSTIHRPVTVKKTAWKKVRRKGTTLRLSWKKVKGMKYQIQYSANAGWADGKKKMIRKNCCTIKGLKRDKHYAIRIRCVKTVNGRKYYSRWSKKRKI